MRDLLLIFLGGVVAVFLAGTWAIAKQDGYRWRR